MSGESTKQLSNEAQQFHVYRIGLHQSKWLCVLDNATGIVEKDLEAIKAREAEKHKKYYRNFDYVEYLGRG